MPVEGEFCVVLNFSCHFVGFVAGAAVYGVKR